MVDDTEEYALFSCLRSKRSIDAIISGTTDRKPEPVADGSIELDKEPSPLHAPRQKLGFIRRSSSEKMPFEP